MFHHKDYQLETTYIISVEDQEKDIIFTETVAKYTQSDYQCAQDEVDTINQNPQRQVVVYLRERDWEKDEQVFRLENLLDSAESSVSLEKVEKVMIEKRAWLTF